MTLGWTPRHFALQVWRLATSTVTLRGRRGGINLRFAWRGPLVAGDAAALCVAGVALGDVHRHFAWRLATSTFGLRGRCGTCDTGLALVARLGPVGRR